MPDIVQIVDYSPEYAKAFKELNERWITGYFSIEGPDIQTLNNPQEIVDNGGHIFVALYNNTAVGVCALRKVNDKLFELCKFAVDTTYQGLGIGKAILTSCITTAKKAEVKKLYLLRCAVYLPKRGTGCFNIACILFV